jgi:hypothetical protein
MMKAILFACVAAAIGCGPGARPNGGNGDGGGGGGGDGGCAATCSADLHSVVDCHGTVITQCSATDACDVSSGTCVNACTAAQDDHRSVGCDYYATDMESFLPTYCFAAFVANTWTSAAHISVEYKGTSLDPSTFTSVPSGSGSAITYGAYNANTGIPPGSVGLVFLSGSQGTAPDCPLTPATTTGYITGTGLGSSFHITTDVPVVAYEMNPYGGGEVAVTGASLLIPTSAWDVNYVAVNVSPADTEIAASPSLNIVAAQNDTTVTLTPVAAVTAGGGVPAGSAGQPMTITLAQGEYAQITQTAELTGSVVSSNNPVGFMAGQNCMRYPIGTAACDHGEQMVPPVKAMSSTYVGVMYRPRASDETETFFRVIGAVDGTQLTYSSNVGGPPTLGMGSAVAFETGTPFTVSSQDANHPFMLFTYMTSADFLADGEGYGDPDFVYDVPPAQYLTDYVFFSDPTYPETNLVVVRAPGSNGQFADVMLDCSGALTGWQPVGSYQWTRADLQTGFGPVGNCNNGRHEITSDAPFGLQVWGWGTPQTGTAYVSYGYPAGMNIAPINTVVIE